MTKEKCPICQTEMETWHDSLDGWCLMEEYIGCPNKCYSYHYYTGTTEITIKDKTFSWYHTFTPEDVSKLQQEINDYIKEIADE